MISLLPESSKVNVPVFSRVFSHTTNSYKYLFFRALLSNLHKVDVNADFSLDLKEIKLDFILYGWRMLNYFHLSFGVQDKFAGSVKKLAIDPSLLSATGAHNDDLIKKEIWRQHKQIELDKLFRYVQFRFIRPFFSEDLRSLYDPKVNDAIYELARDKFDTIVPIYKFSHRNSGGYINLHPDWAEYLTINYPIIDGWVKWCWASYLQSRNPNSPSIVNKLMFPIERQTLAKQTSYWKRVMDHEEVTCIYSGEVLNGKSFSLDHFIPWSFICHDQLWNLVPVTPAANSSKLNALPHQKYLYPFILNQHKGLVVSSKIMNNREWERFTEPFVADLRMQTKELLDKTKLGESYNNTMGSLLALAEQSGFEKGWAL